VPREKLFAQARDELFSHINRCGVLSATEDDRTAWMNETIDYIGERYPDLVDSDLRELHAVGIRFCQPAINNVPAAVVSEPDAEAVTVAVPGNGTAAGPPLSATPEMDSDSAAAQEQDGSANAA